MMDETTSSRPATSVSGDPSTPAAAPDGSQGVRSAPTGRGADDTAGRSHASPDGSDARGHSRGGDARAPYGWWPLVVVMAVSLVDRLESSVISSILPLLQAEWGFSDTAGGSLSAAIAITGTLVALPAGYLADRVNRKNLLAVVVALWSVITLGSAVAISFAMFYATRLVLAAADSIDNPSQVTLLTDYYSVAVRPKVLGWHRMLTFAGGALGTLYGALVGGFFGWRAVFYAILVPGLVVAWWCFRLTEPRRGEADRRAALASRRAAREDVGEAPGGRDAAGRAGAPAMPDMSQPPGWRAFKAQVGTVVRIRTVVLVYSGLASLFFALNGIFFWLPTFYLREFGLEVQVGGSLTAGITLFGVVGGTWAGGVMGERWHGRVTGARVVVGAGGIIVGSLVFNGALFSPTLALQVISLLVAVAFMSLAIPNLQAAIADALPANQRGVGFSLLGVFITGGAFGPLLVGAISDATGSLVRAFAILLVPMVIGGMVTMFARGTYEGDAARALDAAAGDGPTVPGGGSA
jgi:MFS family permease